MDAVDTFAYFSADPKLTCFTVILLLEIGFGMLICYGMT